MPPELLDGNRDDGSHDRTLKQFRSSYADDMQRSRFSAWAAEHTALFILENSIAAIPSVFFKLGIQPRT